MSFILYFIQNSSDLLNYLIFFFFLDRWLLKPSGHMGAQFSESLL